MSFKARKFVSARIIAMTVAYVNAQTGPVPVIGMTTGFDQATGRPPPRMNINTLDQEGGPMWNLLIRGLDALQNKPEDDIRSHFILADGMPYAPYNDVGPDPKGSMRGYCPHQSPQLISWHRAYLALYEQNFGEAIQRIAVEYTNTTNASAYQDAAQKLRLPYWDWASDPALPPSSVEENVTVGGPDGDMVLHNPLYSYRWQTYPLNGTRFPGQGSMGPTTTRDGHGNSSDILGLVKDSVYRTFSSVTTYDQMASMAGSSSSFESPHNVIHNYVGGSFSSLDLTSFDALFMLHHCNLDRLAAMWTASHDDQLQAASFTSQGLYSTAQGEIITADSPLKPFYQADGKTFHTGKTAQNTEAFGYTYPDIPFNGQGRNENIIVQINRLYGNRAKNSTATSRPRREWFIELRVEKANLPLPCSIDVYLGNQLAGRTQFLNMPKTGLAYDELPLSRAISRLDVDDKNPGTVERKLISDTHVKITQQDDVTIDIRDIPSLHINIVREDVTPPSTESEFPLYSNRHTVKALVENGL
ncbi:Di-copper centre-containing protein [Nemania sp. FL0916]|nr:Di-copper centre-containing protein [Nemania sp. FL0916]